MFACQFCVCCQPHRTAPHCTALRCTAESYTELERFNKITICDTHDRCGGARCSGLIDPNPPTTSCVSAAAAAAAGDCCPSLLRSFVFYLIVCPPPCSSPFPPPPPPPPPPPAFLLLLRLSLLQITPLVRAWSLACVSGGAGAGVSPFLLVVAAFSVFTCLALQDRILNLALSLTRTGTRTGTLPAPRNGASARPPPPITIPWCVVVSAFARCETVVVPANTHHHAHVRVSGRAHRCV